MRKNIRKNMWTSDVHKSIEKLKKMINYHRYLYHVMDRQEISDAALDSLKHELYKLEQQFPEFITFDSPTQRVGGKPLKKFKKIKHRVPMLSIEDVSSEKELLDWENYLKRLEGAAQFEYFAELKIDGLAVALIYKNGVFESGATRGDGKIGEDVTQNLKTIETIPLKIQDTKYKIQDRLEIRGEVYMEKKDFDKVNEERKKKGEAPYANPRNLAAGSIRQLNPKLTASRPLKFLAYDLITDLGQKNHSQKHQTLMALGFKTNLGRICKNLSDIVDFWQDIIKKRETLPFQIDGIVISVNNNSLFQKLGIAGKGPRGIKAFKFFPKQAVTIIEDIKAQVGRTGALTPVALLKPVEIGGTTITRATLHNEDELKKLGVKINDTVIISRAGDVIPDIIKVLTELRTGKEKIFQMPKECPVCQGKIIKREGEIILRCENLNCFARQKRYFYYFASKPAFNIEGLGPKILSQIINNGLVQDPADLFEIKQGDLLSLERFAEKSAQNLIEAIQARKKISFPRFIYALGIRNVGLETASDLAEHFKTLENLKKAGFEELEKIIDIGPIVAKSIYDWFQEKGNLEFLEKLKKVGVEIIEQSAKRGLTPLSARGVKPRLAISGKIFVLTGVLESMTREEAKEKVGFLGGKISKAISKKTDYLVVGKEPGSNKLEKAKEFGIKIIKEKEFLQIIK